MKAASRGLQPAIVHLRLIFPLPDPDAAIDRLVAIGFTAFSIEDRSLTAWPDGEAQASAICAALGMPAAHRDVLAPEAVYAGVIPAGAWEVAPRCWVLSQGGSAPSDARVTIQMPSGGGFGDGRHPATELACTLLSDLDLAEAQVLDLGCGTGLLGLLALKLGASAVDFSDIDGDSIIHTRACCQANGLAAPNIHLSDLLSNIPPHRYTVVIANLYGEFVVAMLADPRLSEFLPTGRLVLSGISDSKRAAVETALIDAHFMVTKRLAKDGWWGLLAVRGGSGG